VFDREEFNTFIFNPGFGTNEQAEFRVMVAGKQFKPTLVAKVCASTGLIAGKV
jgi:hypothetical protein